LGISFHIPTSLRTYVPTSYSIRYILVKVPVDTGERMYECSSINAIKHLKGDVGVSLIAAREDGAVVEDHHVVRP